MAGLEGMRNFYQDLDLGMVAARNQLELMPESITTNARAFDLLTSSIRTLTAQFEALAVAQQASAMGGLESFFGPKAPLGAKFLPIVGRNRGGSVPGFSSGGGVSMVPGPSNIDYDAVLGSVPVGGFVLNKKAKIGRAHV